MLSPDYIVGLTEGEGCFLVCLEKIIESIFDFLLLRRLETNLSWRKCESFLKLAVFIRKSNVKGKLPAYAFEAAKRDDVYNVIIPFFEKNRLRGYKAKSFAAFAEIAKIVKGRQDKRKLTKEELEYVTIVRSGMNKHYGSPDAENPLVGWERAKTSRKRNPSS